MGAHIEYIKLITTTEPKNFCFGLPRDAYNNLAN